MQYDYPAVQSVEGGIDWITSTCDDRGDRTAFQALAESILEREFGTGNRLRAGRWQGYETLACSGVVVGNRGDGSLLRCSGATADEHWRNIVMLATNISRLDLQATVLLVQPEPHMARSIYDRALTAAGVNGHRARATYITNSEGGQTTYLGSRRSDRMLRVYDKGIESRTDEKGKRWRYELETKGRLAYHAALQVHLSGPESWVAVRAVAAELDRRKLPRFQCTSPICVRSPVRCSDDMASREWLHTQVRPTVQRLRQRLGVLEVLRALGLGDVAADAWRAVSQKPN